MGQLVSSMTSVCLSPEDVVAEDELVVEVVEDELLVVEVVDTLDVVIEVALVVVGDVLVVELVDDKAVLEVVVVDDLIDREYAATPATRIITMIMITVAALEIARSPLIDERDLYMVCLVTNLCPSF